MRNSLRLTANLIIAAGLAAALYVRIGLDRWNLNTGLLLIVAVTVGLFVLCEVAAVVFGRPRRLVGARVSIATVSLLWVALELYVRFLSGAYRSYSELAENGGYRAMYLPPAPTWFRVYRPNGELSHARTEFSYPRSTNSLGLPEREIPAEKRPNEYRIIALGDSFTEGIGAPSDQSWPSHLERRLSERSGSTVTVFNGGVSGSDPGYEYILFKEKLGGIALDLVIMAVTPSDPTDILLRGGAERFQPDGTTRFKEGPSWEWLYGISHLYRMIAIEALGYDVTLVPKSNLPAFRTKADDAIVQAVTSAANLARARRVRFLVALLPNRTDGLRGSYSVSFARLVERIRTLPEVHSVDVLKRWKSAGLLNQVAPESLYWPIDGHNTPRGYEAIGEAVAGYIVEADLLDAPPEVSAK